MVKNIAIGALTAALSLSLIGSALAHDAGGKDGVLACLNSPQSYTRSHCIRHFKGWVDNNHERFIPENPYHPQYPYDIVKLF